MILLYILGIILYFYFAAVTIPLTILGFILWMAYHFVKTLVWSAKHPKQASVHIFSFCQGAAGELKFLVSPKLWATAVFVYAATLAIGVAYMKFI